MPSRFLIRTLLALTLACFTKQAGGQQGGHVIVGEPEPTELPQPAGMIQPPANAREVVIEALMSTDPAEQAALVRSLLGSGDPDAVGLLTAWREGYIYYHDDFEGDRFPVRFDGEADGVGRRNVVRLDNGEPVPGVGGQPMRATENQLELAFTDSRLRQAMRSVTDMAALVADNHNRRLAAVRGIALEQNPDKIEALELRLPLEPSRQIQREIEVAIAMSQLRLPEREIKLAACRELERLTPIPARDTLRSLAREAETDGDDELAAAATDALAAIERHITRVNAAGTVFRGLSSGSILLIAAIGLAITFGLMGVINMAHGELIAVGAYTAYIVQCVFQSGLRLSPFGYSVAIPGFNASEGWFQAYFLFAIPLSFLVAALVGLAIERTIIRHLYRRPLESLLATWGLSLVLQQLFRLVFGASNVQVESPVWLSGNWTVYGVMFGWNRVFVIGFALLIILVTYLFLNRTRFGLLVRAVVQNRQMAACMGVRTERVNMITFAFGSGLAGLAGAFLSQIGNVGPSLGQSYLIDSFMTVVVGGVGKLIGTVISAFSIGMADQSLQQILLNPVLGKILVLLAIILFLQFRPKGLFTTQNRSLEE